MLAKQDVEVFDLLYIFVDIDAGERSKLDGGDQCFASAKHPLRHFGINQHPVLTADQQIAVRQAIAQGTCCNPHGTVLGLACKGGFAKFGGSI